jgi:hypothetical protein
MVKKSELPYLRSSFAQDDLRSPPLPYGALDPKDQAGPKVDDGQKCPLWWHPKVILRSSRSSLLILGHLAAYAEVPSTPPPPAPSLGSEHKVVW